MGSGKRYEMHEIDETRAAQADDDFEAILKRIQTAGGTIVKDEEYPLYDDIGAQEFEVGMERVVECNLEKTDFEFTRQKHNFRITGSGSQKGLEELSRPKIITKLRKKADSSSDWQIVDFEDIL